MTSYLLTQPTPHTVGVVSVDVYTWFVMFAPYPPRAQQHFQNQEARGLTWPGHKYLGPGNSLNKGPPVDAVDAAAYRHDLAYDRATSFSDVKDADLEAIKSFSRELFNSAHVPALMGV